MKNKKDDLIIETSIIDKLAEFIKNTGISLVIVIIVCAVGILFMACRIVYNYYHEIERTVNPNVLEELKDKYSKKFKIVAASTDEYGFGIYSLYYKDDKNVVFNVVKDKETRKIYDDFDYRYKKYYVDKCPDINVKEHIKVKEEYKEINKCQFLAEYEFWFEVSEYEELEQITDYIYSLYDYIYNNAKNPYILINGGMVRKGDYISNISFQYGKEKKEFLKELQEDYNKYFNNAKV